MKSNLIIIVLVLLTGCAKQEEGARTAQQPQGVQAESGGETKTAAGATWTQPASWKEMPPKPMRLTTYEIPSADDAETGECAVFFFGKGEGGNVELNIARWVSQFEDATKPERSEREVDGMKVHLVDLTGVFLAPGGPAMQSQGKKEDYRLLGAIVEAPDGLVFFKATGPSATMSAGKEEFDTLIGSLTAN